MIIFAIFIIVSLISLFAYYLYLHKKRESQLNAVPEPQIQQIEYQQAVQLFKEMLQQRYADDNGYIAPYARDPEMNFNGSIGTLRKALQENTRRPNPRYVQDGLNKLSGSELQYHVLRPKISA